MTPLDIRFLSPELLLFIFALFILVLGVLKVPRFWTGLFACLAIPTALLALMFSFQGVTSAFFNLLHCDGLSVYLRFLILIATGFIILLSLELDAIDDADRGEFYFFLLTLSISMMVAVASHNLMMLYIAVEAVSIISYILIGYFKHDKFSSEAGLKYFLFGALSTGIMLYGISIFYGLCQSLDIVDISMAGHVGGAQAPLFILASLFVFAGLAFKCSLAPFHLAVPDAYQGAPTPVTVFLSIGPKAMGFAVLTRFLMTSPTLLMPHWPALAPVLAMATMTVANITALRQSNIKRLLAYSSIAHAGFMLIALSAVNAAGLKALFFYLFIYIFMNVGAFGCVIYTNRLQINEYAGLSRQQPLIALIMAVALLSLAGLPPLGGFMAKFLILAAAIEAKLYFLAIVAVLNSVIALFYYLRIIKVMYLHEPKSILPATVFPVLLGALIVTLLANIMFGIWPQAALQWIPS